MQTRVNHQFRVEVRRYVLRFNCEWCAHFDADRAACANGYPTAPHRRQDLDSIHLLTFCKMFELG